MGILKRFRKRVPSSDKWVVFDFDGTIAETSHHLVSFYNEHVYPYFNCREMGVEDLDALRDLALFDKLKYLEIPLLKLPSVIRRCRKKFRVSLMDLPMVEGLADVLVSIQASGYKLAIISSNRKKNIEQYLEARNISLFEEIFCDKGRSLFVKHKTIHKFLKEKAIKPSQMLYVGDECRDVNACKKVHVPVVAVSWGWDSHKRLLNAAKENQIVDVPNQLMEKVRATLH